MAHVSKRLTIIHIAFWMFLWLIIFWVLWSEAVYRSFWVATSLIGVLVASFYAHLFLLRQYLSKRQYHWYNAGLLVVIMIAPLLLVVGFAQHLNINQAFFVHIIPAFVLTVISLLGSGLLYGIQEWFVRILKRKELEQQNTNAELLYLKSQINPHFLFNTLNNLHGLALKQAPETSQSILRLASMMRYMLYESNAATVPLQRELEYLQDFIALQQLRYHEGDIVAVEVTGDVAQHQVAPLLFIQLLENAYKHSPRRLHTADIRLMLTADNRDIHFSLQNPIGLKSAEPLNKHSGIGLNNVRKRLNLLYPGTHEFTITTSGTIFQIQLRIKNTRKLHT